MDSNKEFSYAMQLVTSISLTMVLKTVMKLQVLETIAEAGPDVALSAHEIAYSLSMSNQDAPYMLDRMLRLLASYSIVTCTQRDGEMKPVRMYGLAPVAKYLTRNEDGVSLAAVMELSLDNVYLDSWFKIKDSVVKGGVPFEKVHGKNVFDYMESDSRFKEVFNSAMVNYSTLVMNEILKCYHGFNNVKQLVDVGGGIGVSLSMIISKHPTINAINFDLSHVIQHAPFYPRIKHVEGDMFLEVPQGDAIFMKWILHDWSDDHCVKLLKNCYKALPNDGKVIVVDVIMPSSSDTSASAKSTAQMDAIMMTICSGGKERTENEILALAKGAGFTKIKKKCQVYDMWVVEIYK